MMQSNMLCNTAPSGFRRLISAKRWRWRYLNYLPMVRIRMFPLFLLILICLHGHQAMRWHVPLRHMLLGLLSHHLHYPGKEFVFEFIAVRVYIHSPTFLKSFHQTLTCATTAV